ncbi:MAG: hypothetical protein IIW20_03140 [Clostridia bacterium]|nr:hypothetical protein [Clostridia bacterium]
MKNKEILEESEALAQKEGRLIFKEVKRTEFLTLEYRVYEASEGKAPYSIEVIASNGKNEKSAVLSGAFDLREEAKSFFDLISRNLVTPVSLSYVYEDYCE